MLPLVWIQIYSLMRLRIHSLSFLVLPLLLLLDAGISPSYSQNHQPSTVDSLLQELQKAPADTHQVQLLYALSWQLSYSHPDSAMDFAQRGLDLARRLDFIAGMAKHQKILGDINDVKGNYSRAMDYYNQALQRFDSLDKYDFLSHTYMAMGVTYLHVGDYTRALEFNQKALEIAEKHELHENIPACYTNIGIIHRNRGNYQQALQYYKKAIEGFRELNQPGNLARAYTNIGLVHTNMNQYERALEYFTRALDQTESSGGKQGLAFIKGNMAMVYEQQKKYEQALTLYRQALLLFEKAGYKNETAQTFGNIASVHNHMAREAENQEVKRQHHQKALEYAGREEKLAREMGSLARKEQAFHQLSMAYAGLNHYRRAYQYKESHLRVRDSLFNEEKNRQMEEMEARFQMERKERQNQLLRNKNELQQAKLRRARLIRTITIGGIVLLLVFSVIFYLRYRKQKQMTEKLRRKNTYIQKQTQRLNELNQTKNKLISIISHDLRSPVSSILSSAQLLQDGYIKDENELQDFHQQIYENSASVLHLLENLLSWAKNQQNEVVFQPRKQKLYPVIQHNVGLLSGVARNKDVVLKDQAEDSEMEAVFDQEMISTAIRNLISNAIKFTPAGGEVEAGLNDLGDRVEVYVSDTGIGMKPEDKERVLQGKVSYTTKGTEQEGGSGMGLQVSREFIKQHGGDLKLESTPDQGTTFRFTLPKHRLASPAD
jgi:signal transduction histidine kinase/tetratricopeptide (TPR) repeat protein